MERVMIKLTQNGTCYNVRCTNVQVGDQLIFKSKLVLIVLRLKWHLVHVYILTKRLVGTLEYSNTYITCTAGCWCVSPKYWKLGLVNDFSFISSSRIGTITVTVGRPVFTVTHLTTSALQGGKWQLKARYIIIKSFH